MSHHRSTTTHFIAIAKSDVRLSDSATAADGCGCVVCACRDEEFAERLIELFRRTETDGAVELTILPADSLNQAQLVLANRDLQRAESTGANLSSEEYCTNDPTYAQIGRIAVTLGELAYEIESVNDDTSQISVDGSTRPNDDEPREGSAAGTLQESLERLERALDRHRFTFLFFATAKRRNEQLRESRNGMNEAVFKEDVLGYEAVMKDIDDGGDFLFRHRSYFERFAEKAIGEFGPGEGLKPLGEESTHPYWSLEEGSASYLQETAEAVLAAARTVERVDADHVCSDVILKAADVAYDYGRSRWYSAVVTNWEFLSRLDHALATARRRILWTSTSAPAAPDDYACPWDTYFLGVKWDERTYNHDPVTCGTWLDDPNYLPASNGTLYFYKCFYDMAERLLRLFNRSIRPALSSDGETKIDVTFVLAAEDKVDPDEAFLIDEEIDAISNQVYSRHHEWRVEQGLVIADDFIWNGEHLLKEKPPLGDPELKATFLFDRAERWHHRIEPPRKASRTANKPAAEESKKDEVKVDGAHPLLPTAIITAMSLRDLARIAQYYPDAMASDEINRLFEKLKSSLITAVKAVGLPSLFDTMPVPPICDPGADVVFAAIMATVMMHHKDANLTDVDSKESFEANQQVFRKCLVGCNSSIRDIAQQLDRIKLFDCLIPTQNAGPDFGSPRRLVRLIETYWALLRRLLIHHVGAHATFRPHPLRLMITSVKGRFLLAFEQLRQFGLGTEGPETIESFINILLDGDSDAFDEDWTYQQLDTVDRFVEDLRSKIGIGVFELTYAEADFCDYSEKAIGEYSERADKAWKRMWNRAAPASPKPPESSSKEPVADGQVPHSTAAPKDLSQTKMLVLRTVRELGATDEAKKVSAPKIFDKLKGIADNRLRAELSSLRELQLLGGAKGTQGYWLTKTGLETARAAS